MIYKRFGNPHIKLWNNELEKLFAFNALPDNIKKDEDDSVNSTEKLNKDGKRVELIEDLDDSHLKDILSQKVLLPVSRVVESDKLNEDS